MQQSRLRLSGSDLDYYSLPRLADTGFGDPNRLPITIKVLLEGLLREAEAGRVSEISLRALTRWPESPPKEAEVPYKPSRVLLQDFTGVPAVVDLAAMRSAMQRAGKDAGRIDPLVQADLVIDHSVQVDAFGSLGAYARNIEREYVRNGERYALLRWAQQAFHNFSVVPPGMGICHQVNLERLSRVVQVRDGGNGAYALPDTLLGTDSLFPVDAQTLRYLETTGRDRQLIELVERYTRAQGMFRTDDAETPVYSELIELDLDTIEPSVAGPKRPQDRVALPSVWQSF